MAQRGDEITTKFKVDLTEFKKGITEANRNIRMANAQFNEATAGMDDWSKSASGIEQKLSQLNSVLTNETQKLKEYKSQLTAINGAQDENAKRASELKKQLERAMAEFGEGSAEVKKYQKALNEVEREYASNARAAEDMAVKIHNQQATINRTERDIRNYENSLSDLDKANVEVRESTEQVNEGFSLMKGAIAGVVAGGITALIGQFANLSDSTREYREDMNKLKTAFDEGGFSAEQATDVYKEFYAVIGEEDRSVEAVNHLAKMVDTQQELEKWTTIATGVWATFGDSLPIEGLTEAANETAKVGAVTGVLADALNWAGESEDDFNKKLEKANTEQERQKLIMETLTGLYEGAATTYRENNKQILEANKANSDLTDAMAKLGEKAEPVFTKMKQGTADLLNSILSLTTDASLDSVGESLEGAFDGFIDNTLPKIVDGIEFFTDNKDEIISGVAGIGAAMMTMNVANMIMGLVTSFKAFKTAQEGATVAQWLLNSAMLANPIGLITALIAGLGAGLVVLWHQSEDFRNFWIGLWDDASDKIKGFGIFVDRLFTETVPGYFDEFVDFMSGIPSEVLQFYEEMKADAEAWKNDMMNKAKDAGTKFLTNVIDRFKRLPPDAQKWLSDTVKKVTSFGTDLGNKGIEAGKKLYNGTIGEVTKLPKAMLKAGADLVKGFWDGIMSLDDWIKKKVGDFFGGIADKALEVLEIHSPSRLMIRAGIDFIKGFELGNKKEQPKAVKTISKVAEKLISAVEDVFDFDFEHSKNMKLFDGFVKGIAGSSSDVSKQMNKQFDSMKAQCVAKINEIDKEMASTQSANRKANLEKQKAEFVEALSALESEQMEFNDNLNNISNKFTSEIQKSLDEIDRLNEAYNQAVENRANQIANFAGLFDQIKPDEDVFSTTDMITNLQQQVDILAEWTSNLSQLEMRGVDTELIDELRELGVNSNAQLAVMVTMTDEELKKYADLFRQKNAIARQQAVKELQGLKTDTDIKIKELQKQTTANLKNYTKIWLNETTSLINQTSNNMEKLTGKLNQSGKNAMEGLRRGLLEKEPSLLAEAQRIADAIAETINSALEVASPSRRMMRTGAFVVDGLRLGVKNKADSLISYVKEMTNEAFNIDVKDLKNGFKQNIGKVFDISTDLKSNAVSLRMPKLQNQLGPTENKTIIFNQYNSSPEPLNRLDVYRDTNKALLQLRSV